MGAGVLFVFREPCTSRFFFPWTRYFVSQRPIRSFPSQRILALARCIILAFSLFRNHRAAFPSALLPFFSFTRPFIFARRAQQGMQMYLCIISEHHVFPSIASGMSTIPGDSFFTDDVRERYTKVSREHVRRERYKKGATYPYVERPRSFDPILIYSWAKCACRIENLREVQVRWMLSEIFIAYESIRTARRQWRRFSWHLFALFAQIYGPFSRLSFLPRRSSREIRTG